MSHITTDQFTRRFAQIVISGNTLPKKQLDRHIMLLSTTLSFETDRIYAEPELNRLLRVWTDSFGENIGLDHVTLRRLLVDERYLRRDPAGTGYQLAMDLIPYTFDNAINTLDLQVVIDQAILEREQRKQQHLAGGR